MLTDFYVSNIQTIWNFLKFQKLVEVWLKNFNRCCKPLHNFFDRIWFSKIPKIISCQVYSKQQYSDILPPIVVLIKNRELHKMWTIFWKLRQTCLYNKHPSSVHFIRENKMSREMDVMNVLLHFIYTRFHAISQGLSASRFSIEAGRKW